MQAYFDSSVILSHLIADAFRFKAAKFWNTYTKRVASILVHAECINVLRRVPKQSRKNIPTSWVKESLEELEEMMKEVEFIPVDDVVLEALRNEPLTAECKSLDALHLASALVFKKHAPPGFAFCTFDTNLSLIANKLGFVVP